MSAPRRSGHGQVPEKGVVAFSVTDTCCAVKFTDGSTHHCSLDSDDDRSDSDYLKATAMTAHRSENECVV